MSRAAPSALAHLSSARSAGRVWSSITPWLPRMIPPRALGLGLALALAMPVLGFPVSFAWAGAESPIDLDDPAHVAAGRHLFNTTCTGYCHGRDGIQGQAPSLQNRPELDARRLHWVITKGRKRGGAVMPAWKDKLSAEQIWQLIAFILSLRDAPPVAED